MLLKAVSLTSPQARYVRQSHCCLKKQQFVLHNDRTSDNKNANLCVMEGVLFCCKRTVKRQNITQFFVKRSRKVFKTAVSVSVMSC